MLSGTRGYARVTSRVGMYDVATLVVVADVRFTVLQHIAYSYINST